MFDTDHEAVAYRDALLEDSARLLASVRHQWRVDAPPPPPSYPDRRIYLVRGKRVMLDADVAALFCTRTGVLNQTVSRHLQRFPDDFAFRLTPDETARLRYLGAVKPPGRGGRRTLPRVFTDLGLLMVATLLKTPTAIKLNLEIVNTVCTASQTLTPAEDE
jgi:hypothetical protein